MSDLTELLKSIEKDRKYMIGSGGLYGCNDVWLLVDRIEELESKEIALQKAIAETVVQLDNSQLSLIHADEQITELEAELDSYKMRQGLIPIHIASPEEDNE